MFSRCNIACEKVPKNEQEQKALGTDLSPRLWMWVNKCILNVYLFLKDFPHYEKTKKVQEILFIHGRLWGKTRIWQEKAPHLVTHVWLLRTVSFHVLGESLLHRVHLVTNRTRELQHLGNLREWKQQTCWWAITQGYRKKRSTHQIRKYAMRLSAQGGISCRASKGLNDISVAYFITSSAVHSRNSKNTLLYLVDGSDGLKVPSWFTDYDLSPNTVILCF